MPDKQVSFCSSDRVPTSRFAILSTCLVLTAVANAQSIGSSGENWPQFKYEKWSEIKSSTSTLYTLVGTVRDAATDDTIPNATLNIQGTSITTVSNDDGAYTFDGLPDPDFVVEVSADGYEIEFESVSMSSVVETRDFYLGEPDGTSCPARKVFKFDPLRLAQLRAIRDNVLQKNGAGRVLVSMYYWSSPYTTYAVDHSPAARSAFISMSNIAVSVSPPMDGVK
jgi:hypothetical protein